MNDSPGQTRTTLFTCLALVGFAANSILCRLALGGQTIDAGSFTTVRLASGAIALSLLVWWANRRAPKGAATSAGDWPSGLALAAYAVGFSFAYLRLDAGTGALILFGCVQLTMIGWGLVRGERPGWLEWLGIALAAGGMVFLNLPGASSPDPIGALLMAVAGAAWGVYSLRGRGTVDPLLSTTGNFWRALPVAVAVSAFTFASMQMTTSGVLLAAVSGSLASGVGYSLWYRALGDLSATRAATVQLVVPILAAAGGVALLGESVTSRLLLAGVVILAGVGLAITARR